MSSSNYCSLTCIQVSQEAGQVDLYSHLLNNFPQFVVIYTVKGISIVNEAKVDVFLEFPCFLCNPTDVGNLISGSSAISKSSLNIWMFSVHILLKPSLKYFEQYLASMWNEHNCTISWTCLLCIWELVTPGNVLLACLSYLMESWQCIFGMFIIYDGILHARIGSHSLL